MGNKKPNSQLETIKESYKRNKWRFGQEEFNQLIKTNNAVNLRLSRSKFLEMFGLLGMESTSYICERMFDCIDKENNEWISLENYLIYMDVLIHGKEKEKLKQSFELLDIRKRGKVTYKDFMQVAVSVSTMWRAALGHSVEIDEKIIKNVFNVISNNKKYFKCKNYVNVVKMNPDLMSWLTKPKEILDDKLEKNVSSKEKNYKASIVQEMIENSKKFAEEVISTVEKVLKIQRGHRFTYKKRSRSFTLKDDAAIIGKQESLKLHDIGKHDFPISTEKGKKNTKSIKTFLPGVERRTLRKKDDVNRTEISDEISIMKAGPTPEIFKLEDCEEDQNEGGEEEENEGGEEEKNEGGEEQKQESGSSNHDTKGSTKSKKKKVKAKTYNEINQSEHSRRFDDSSLEVDSEECKSDINQITKSKRGKSRRSLYQDDNDQEDKIGDIPMSAFESSSSNSDDTFESYENDELYLKYQRERTPIKIDKFSNEEAKGNAAEEILASLRDISIEIDGDFEDVRQNGLSIEERPDRPSLFKKSEAGIRLQQDYSIDDLQSEDCFVQRAETNLPLPQNIKLLDDAKSVNSPECEKIQKEIQVTESLRNLEMKMRNSVTGNYDQSKLQPFLREYMKNESIIKDSRLLFEDLLETSRSYIKKLDQLVTDEDEKVNEEENKELTRKNTMRNIHHGKEKSRVTKARRKTAMAKTMNFVHFGHENFNLVFNIMLGVRKAIDSVINFPIFELQKKDFKIKCVYEIAPWRTTDRDDLKACRFLDYAPQVFDSIRKKFNVEREEYSQSLGPDQILNNLLTGDFSSLSELCSSGKSGSFFYYTADGKYMLKTISKTEFRFFKRILRNYYNHIEKYDSTLITRIYGLHKMIFSRKTRRSSVKTLYFCIMNNVFHTTKEIHRRYDLKGSTQGRTTKYANNIFDPTIALKDNDIVDEENYFIIQEDMCEKFTKQVEADVQFFKENNIIDYSLLIGIHDKKADPNTGKNYVSNISMMSESDAGTRTVRDYVQSHSLPFYEQDEGGIQNFNKKEIYFLGIIDILTEYNTKKKMEHFFKRLKYGNSISCVPPDRYAKRFDEFINSRVVTPRQYKVIAKDLKTRPPLGLVEDIENYERQSLL